METVMREIGKQIGRVDLRDWFVNYLLDYDPVYSSRWSSRPRNFQELRSFIKNSGFRYVNGLGKKLHVSFDPNVDTAFIAYDPKKDEFDVVVGTVFLVEEFYQECCKLAGTKYKQENAIIVALAIINFMIYHEVLHQRFSDLSMLINLGGFVVDMTEEKYHNPLFTQMLNLIEDLFIEYRAFRVNKEFLSGLIKDFQNLFYTEDYYSEKEEPLGVLDYVEYSRGWYGNNRKRIEHLVPEISAIVIEHCGNYLPFNTNTYDRLEITKSIYDFFEELREENEDIDEQMQEAEGQSEAFKDSVAKANEAINRGEKLSEMTRGQNISAMEELLDEIKEAAEAGNETAKNIMQAVSKVEQELRDIKQVDETVNPFDYDGYQPPKNYNDGTVKYIDVTEIPKRVPFTTVVKENWLSAFSSEIQQFLMEKPDEKAPDKRGRIDASRLHNVVFENGMYRSTRIHTESKGQPNIIILCDVSGSTRGYAENNKAKGYQNKRSTIFDFILSGAYFCHIEFVNSQIPHSIYAHTTGYNADMEIIGVAAYNNPLNPNTKRRVTTVNPKERFSLLNGTETRGNADGDALAYVAEAALDKDAENLIIVISDGAPSETLGRERVTPEERLKTNIGILRAKGVHVVAMTVVTNKTVVDANNRIYGKEFNIVAPDNLTFIQSIRNIIGNLLE